MSDIPETSSAIVPVDRNADSEKEQPNNEVDGIENLSEEEKLAAEESLAAYCKPVELYNYLQNRAKDRPSFLQRCLDYRIKAKREKRVVVTVSLLWNDDKTRSLFPLCICLTRLDPNDKAKKEALKYQAVRIFTFRGSSEIDENGSTQVQANFLIPKLAMEAKSHQYYLLILASVENPISLSEVNAVLMPWDVISNESRDGENCLYQEVSFIDIYDMWDEHSEVSSENNIQIHYDHHLIPCILKYCFQRKSKCITIHDYSDSQDERDLKQLQISIFTKKPRPMEKSYDRTLTSREVGSMPSSLSHIPRLEKGNVSFNYRYYNNKLQRTEVTEDFCCPFCLVKCPTFKGLKCHLTSSHDAFNFEFPISEDRQSVHVSMKVNNWRLEIIGDGVDPKAQAFFFCAKRPKRREQKNISLGRENDTDLMLIDAEIPAGDTETIAEDTELLEKADGSNAIILHPGQDFAPLIPDHDHETLEVLQIEQEGVSNAIILHSGPDCVAPMSDNDHETTTAPLVNQEGVSNAIILHPGSDCVPPISEHDHGTPEVPQSSKRRKLPIDPNDSKIPAKLKKRTFYHSHKYQAMALEEVLLDEDSEDEINEYAEEVEERRKIAMLDVTDDQKRFLFMWNTFIRKQRVVADGHVNWACEAFTKHHCAELAQSLPLSWCWRLFMIKLWNHNLLDARTFNQCSIILEEYKKQNSDISQRLKQIQF